MTPTGNVIIGFLNKIGERYGIVGISQNMTKTELMLACSLIQVRQLEHIRSLLEPKEETDAPKLPQ